VDTVVYIHNGILLSHKEELNWLGTVAHACNLATREEKIRRVIVQGHLETFEKRGRGLEIYFSRRVLK
jgi:hypothetical protein